MYRSIFFSRTYCLFHLHFIPVSKCLGWACHCLISVPPSIVHERRLLTMHVGETADITCSAIGIPDPKITWMKDGRTIQPSDSKYEITQLGTLVIHDLEVRWFSIQKIPGFCQTFQKGIFDISTNKIKPVYKGHSEDKILAFMGRWLSYTS